MNDWISLLSLIFTVIIAIGNGLFTWQQGNKQTKVYQETKDLEMDLRKQSVAVQREQATASQQVEKAILHQSEQLVRLEQARAASTDPTEKQQFDQEIANLRAEYQQTKAQATAISPAYVDEQLATLRTTIQRETHQYVDDEIKRLPSYDGLMTLYHLAAKLGETLAGKQLEIDHVIQQGLPQEQRDILYRELLFRLGQSLMQTGQTLMDRHQSSAPADRQNDLRQGGRTDDTSGPFGGATFGA